MANPAIISSFALLENAIEDHLNRTDIDDEGVSQMVIDLAEARFNREIRTLEMLNENTAFTVDSRTETAPTDFLEVRVFELDRTPVVPLEYLTPEEMSQRRVDMRSTGIPLYYTVKANSSNAIIFEFLPTPNDTFTGRLLYYERIPALSDSQTTNWLINAHPDIYLNACLHETCMYLRDYEAAMLWDAKYREAKKKLDIQDARARVGGTPMQRHRVLGGRARRYVR